MNVNSTPMEVANGGTNDEFECRYRDPVAFVLLLEEVPAGAGRVQWDVREKILPAVIKTALRLLEVETDLHRRMELFGCLRAACARFAHRPDLVRQFFAAGSHVPVTICQLIFDTAVTHGSAGTLAVLFTSRFAPNPRSVVDALNRLEASRDQSALDVVKLYRHSYPVEERPVRDYRPLGTREIRSPEQMKAFLCNSSPRQRTALFAMLRANGHEASRPGDREPAMDALYALLKTPLHSYLTGYVTCEDAVSRLCNWEVVDDQPCFREVFRRFGATARIREITMKA